MTTQAIENIKKESKSFYISEDQKAFFQERIEKFKSEIIEDFKKFKKSYPDKTFEDFKAVAHHELHSGNIEGHPLVLTLGIYLNAFDGITSADLD
ncbi:hypothetical protein [Chryseobacterium indoltheticum]|uniref:hypothetical protein n=1 Tax=Chryseobacterium indoltheticum TaxID=254 RepID=UPI0028E7EA2C|nr:hypothetical protein [Chryseobacterium indoltheticum]